MKHKLQYFMSRLSIVILMVFVHAIMPAQNLESVGTEKPIHIIGGLSFNQTAYFSSDSLSRRDPYNYYLSGNININLYGWSVPLSFNYSNHKATFIQPFNNYSIHPQYKWIKAHIGYTSMSFSPYSLNGHLFAGTGIELTPDGPFSLSLMAGRLNKAVEFDSLSQNTSPPGFERWGYGIKAGYSIDPFAHMNAKIGLNIFHAKDKAGSLNNLPDSTIHPGENLVIGAIADISYGHYTIQAEISSSAVCKNLLSGMESGSLRAWNNVMDKLMGSNGTTEFYSAYHLNAGYNAEKYSVGIGYERIDPGYETYGAYYFNNDMQNLTLNGSVRLWNDKVNFSGNAGMQNDNLDNSKASKLSRWVTAVNCNINPDDRLSGSLSYSSFTSFMNIRSQFVNINELTPYDNLDTLNFTQLSATTAASISYIIKNTDRTRQNTSLNINHQKSSEKQNGLDTLGASTFYNFSAMYGYTLVSAGFTASVSFNSSLSQMPEIKSTTLGPSLSLNKLWFGKKLKSTLSIAYNKTYSNGEAVNRILNIRAGSGYRFGKRHNISLNLTYMNRKRMTSEKRTNGEFIGALLYGLNF